MSHSGSEVFGLLVIAFAFLLIAIAGSGRVLKVLDRRAAIMGGYRGVGGGGATGSLGMAGGGTSSLRFSASMTPRHSTMGGGGGGAHSYALTDSIWSDNRFIFGFCAVVVGVLRCAYIFMILMVSRTEEKAGGGTSITGDTLLADTVEAPLAWLFFSLMASILWALRDLLVRVRQSIIGNASGNLSSPQLTPARLGARAGNIGDPADTNTVTSDETKNGGGAESSIGDTMPSLFEQCMASINPYSAVATSVVMFVAILISLGAAWGEKDRQGGSLDTARLIPAVVSSVICFCLMLWSVSSTTQAISVLKSVGIAAHRVVLAFIVMTVFLMVRGILILPPVQQDMCGKAGDQFWRCTFLYDLIDSVAVGVVLALLP